MERNTNSGGTEMDGPATPTALGGAAGLAGAASPETGGGFAAASSRAGASRATSWRWWSR